ncbi:hypothetical protein WJX81_000576 [Elliptochloris bilobata]|uniref:Reverse transcriptase domain-containing protein n=1 Tax=Elliptochloris bilobata TaxID=381761 RepID=A0AAW1RR38_9CHLO
MRHWPDSPDSRALLREYFSVTRRKRRAWALSYALALLRELRADPRALYKRAKPAVPRLPVALQATGVWEAFVRELAQRPDPPGVGLPPAPPAQPTAAQAGPAAELNAAFSAAEVRTGLQLLRNGRSAGSSGLAAEFLRYAYGKPSSPDTPAPHRLQPALAELYNSWFQAGAVPDAANVSLVTPIYKRGDAAEPSNYRPIAVGEPVTRLYAALLNVRLVAYTERAGLRAPSQAGFRPRLSTQHQLFCLQHLVDRATHLRQPLFCCFLDLKGAYDRVPRALLWQALQRLGVHGRMLGALQSLYSNAEYAINVGGRRGVGVRSTRGVKQGCPLSPTLFGLLLDGLHWALLAGAPGAGPQLACGRSVPDLGYADDFCLLATSPAHLQRLLDVAHGFLTSVGMELSVNKTCVMAFGVAAAAAAEGVAWSCGAIGAAAAGYLLWQLSKVVRFVAMFVRAHRLLVAQPNLPCVVDQFNPFDRKARSFTAAQPQRLGIADSRALGGIQRIQIGPCLNVLQISDPWLVAEMLDRKNYPLALDKPTSFPFNFYAGFDQVTSSPPTHSQLTCKTSDPLWRLVRRGSAPALSPANLRKNLLVILMTVHRLVDTLVAAGPDQAVDIDAALMCQTFDALGLVGFGSDFHAAEDLGGPGARACQAIKDATEVLVGDFLNPFRRFAIWTKEWWERRRTVQAVLDAMLSLLEEVQSRGEPDQGDESVAALLFRLRDPSTGQPLPRARLWSEMSIFFLAGMETTAHAATWVLFQLSQHPEVEAAVERELDAAGLLVMPSRPHPRALEHADLAGLVYLQAVIKESQRLLSVLPILFRQAQADVRIGELLVPRGTFCIVHLMAMHLSPHNFEHAEERWFEKDPDMARNVRFVPAGSNPTGAICKGFYERPHAFGGDLAHGEADPVVKRYLPFAAGPRSCPGRPLAEVSAIAGLAVLLSHFRFRLAKEMGGAAGVRAQEEVRITLQPVKGMLMHCIPRGK